MDSDKLKSSITFQNILDYAPDNRLVFKEIERLVIAGNNSIVPFVGAGLSSPIFPLWGETLKIIADKFSDEENKKVVKEFVSKGEFIEAAQFLEEKRSPSNLQCDFQDIFRNDLIKDNLSKLQKMAVWLLPYLFEGLVVTTNLDRVIEEVYEAHQRPFDGELLPGERLGIQTAALRTPYMHYIFKFHGTIEKDGRLDYSKTVFTRSQYDNNYSDGSDLVKLLKDIYNKKPLLFMGCSLMKDRVLDVIETIKATELVNYAIIPCDRENLDKRTKELGELKIRAIFYPENKHEAVRIIMEQLLKKVNPEKYIRLTTHADAIDTDERRYVGRFNYDSELYSTVGRDKELNELSGFVNDKRAFCWWAIVGPGGTGKSRLALTFCKNLPKGWTYKFLKRDDYNEKMTELYLQSENTFFVADYIQANTDKIGKLIKAFSNESLSCKIRLLLLERDGGDWQNEIRTCFKGDVFANHAEYKNRDGFMALPPLDDYDLFLLMKNYVKSVSPLSDKYKKVELSEKNARQLIETLDKVDSGLRRPLYALFLTDSWLMGEKPQKWNREELLSQVLDREEALIEERIQRVVGKKSERMTETIMSILRFATVIKDATTEDIISLLPNEWETIEKKADELGMLSPESFLSKLGIAHDDRMIPITPDILGEFFVLRWIKESANDEIPSRFIEIVWHHPSSTFDFLIRAITDYSDIMDNSPKVWKALLYNDVEWPEIILKFQAVTMEAAANATQRLDICKYMCNVLSKLSESNPYNIRYLVSLAGGLSSLVAKEEANDATTVLNKLEKIYIDNAGVTFMAFDYARGMANYLKRENCLNVDQWLLKLESLRERYPNEGGIATYISSSIIALSEKELLSNPEYHYKIIKELFEKFSNIISIVEDYAVCITEWMPSLDEKSIIALNEELNNIRQSHIENRCIAFNYAYALVHFSLMKGNLETYKELEEMHALFPDTDMISYALSEKLLELCQGGNVIDVKKYVLRLIHIYEDVPNNQYVALNVCGALVSLPDEIIEDWDIMGELEGLYDRTRENDLVPIVLVIAYLNYADEVIKDATEIDEICEKLVRLKKRYSDEINISAAIDYALKAIESSKTGKIGNFGKELGLLMKKYIMEKGE